MAIVDKNQTARDLTNLAAENTWPETQRHLARYYKGQNYASASPDLFKVPKTFDEMINDTKMKVLMLVSNVNLSAMTDKVCEILEANLTHYQLEDLVLVSRKAYESTTSRVAYLVAFNIEGETFRHRFGVNVLDDDTSQEIDLAEEILAALPAEMVRELANIRLQEGGKLKGNRNVAKILLKALEAADDSTEGNPGDQVKLTQEGGMAEATANETGSRNQVQLQGGRRDRNEQRGEQRGNRQQQRGEREDRQHGGQRNR